MALCSSACVSRWSRAVALKAACSATRSSDARCLCTFSSSTSALRVLMVSLSPWMLISSPSILVSSPALVWSSLAVMRSLVLSSSMQKSRCLTSSSFSSRSCETMSSIAFFTRVKASRRAEVASAESFGLPVRAAALASTAAARSRRSVDLVCSSAAALKVLLKRSRASSLCRIEMALATAASSSARDVWRCSQSWSVMLHFCFSSMRNRSSALSDAWVSSLSSLACASVSSAVASCCFLSCRVAWPALISASFAAFTSANACCAAISSFCESERSASKVSFICRRMPKISPDRGWYACLNAGVLSK
mmetsp:Transcript_80421/g.206986  ORF Transcript_80421/g.206986 Transcript_80421/m.206986 type:complete len:307 (+) Transcript_80421:430-1350(+)